MSAKPATIYLGTRSHFRAGKIKASQDAGRYRHLLKRRRSFARHSTNVLRRYHHHHHKKVVHKPGSKSNNNLAKNSSGSSTSKSEMTTSVLHLPTPDLGQQQQNTSTTTSSSSSTAKPGLPSPSSSTSETSDYQRSTPSPNADNEDQFRSLGTSEIDWSQNNDNEDGTKPAPARRKSTSSLVNSSKISNNLVLQQLRVALKKLPEAKLSSLKPIEAVKRRHSDCGFLARSSSMTESIDGIDNNDEEAAATPASVVKKAKVQPRRPLSASLHKGGQGKITEYLPEMKHFIAMRKEKLDRVLNLATPSAAASEAAAPKDDLESSLKLASINEQPHVEALDISSSSKKSSHSNSESGVETGSNDTASVASSGSRHSVSSGIGFSCHRDEDVFEVPRTIRFPPAAPTKCYSEVVICKWELCGNEFDSTGKLLDHLKTIHAVAENQKEETDSSEDSNSIQYKCLWEGCKVYGKGSSSKLWLEKHVMSHGGNKPFQCIVDGCKHRFGTQSLLERHVNNHFKNKESASGAVSTQPGTGSEAGQTQRSNLSSASRSSASNQSTGSCGSKVFRKLIGKRIKYRKTPFSARIFDLFDVGTMAQVRLRLSECEKKCQEWNSEGYLENSHMLADQVVILHSRIIARRADSDGNQRVLQSWSPPNILEDQWILAKDVVPTKRVKLSSLPISARVQLSSQLFNNPTTSSSKRSRGRKLRPQPRSTALS